MTATVTGAPPIPPDELKDALYELYAAAGCPPLSAIVDDLRESAAGLGLSRVPSRVTVGAMFNHAAGLPTREYAVAVAVVLARRAGRAAGPAAAHLGGLWTRAHAWTRPHDREPPERPAAGCDPFVFGVHRPVGEQPVLPAYVPRAHDARVAQVFGAAAGGTSGCLLLVGEPGSGRARSFWEAVRRLPDRWRLWQPPADATPGDVAAGVARARPHTVVWLPDVHDHLRPMDAHDTSAEVAAAVRRLLDDPGRAPVLVLATIWPEPWAGLAAAPAPAHEATAWLRANALTVPDGAGTRTLSGIPELLRCYREAPPAARAVVHAAMDARRFGLPRELPGAFLAYAAAGYLPVHPHPPASAAQVRPWAEEYAAALEHVTAPAPGRPPMLTPVPVSGGHVTVPDASAYRLAPCLDHAARLERADAFPPPRFWEALTRTVTDPAVLLAAGLQAQLRGRLSRAGQAYDHAARRGDTHAMTALALLRESTHDRRGAHRLALHAADLGDTAALRRLAVARDDMRAAAEADALARDAAARGDLGPLMLLAERHAGSARGEALYRTAAGYGDVAASARVAMIRLDDGDVEGAEPFALRAAEAGDTGALQRLARARRAAGDLGGAERLALSAAELGFAYDRRDLAQQRRRFSVQQVAQALARRCAGTADDSEARRLNRLLRANASMAMAMAVQIAARRHTGALRELVVYWHGHGDPRHALRLANICAARGDPVGLGMLAAEMARAGDMQPAAALARRAAARGDTTAMRRLARRHEQRGEHAQAVAVLHEAAAAGNAEAMCGLARHHERAGKIDEAAAMYLRAAAHGVVHALCSVALLHDSTGATHDAGELAAKAAEEGDTSALRELAQRRLAAGDYEAAADLLQRAARHGDELAGRDLARIWHRHHGGRALTALAARAAETGCTAPLRYLAELCEQAGDQASADALYWTAHEHGDPAVLLNLPHMRQEDHGDPALATALALEAADRGRVGAVTDLALLRAACGDLDGAEALNLAAMHRGQLVDLHEIVRLRLADGRPPPHHVAELYHRAAERHVGGALLVLARLGLAAGDPGGAPALCLAAANRAVAGAAPELARVLRALGDTTSAALVEQYGLSDDGSPASAFLW
ncbi:hypothetical protein [Dactylosporangium sp. CA-139066]|uniref:hypothetical protein n=1 Tax=Dactylosporangium sp. CA-139066 TaxID=3239930 RepID=UPI003D924376